MLPSILWILMELPKLFFRPIYILSSKGSYVEIIPTLTIGYQELKRNTPLLMGMILAASLLLLGGRFMQS